MVRFIIDVMIAYVILIYNVMSISDLGSNSTSISLFCFR